MVTIKSSGAQRLFNYSVFLEHIQVTSFGFQGISKIYEKFISAAILQQFTYKDRAVSNIWMSMARLINVVSGKVTWRKLNTEDPKILGSQYKT